MIPKKVTICGQKFKIMFRNKIVEDNDDCLGVCKTDENKIVIKRGLPLDKENEVFLHECIHAIDEIMILGLGERKVSVLATTLMDFLKVNKVRI